MEDETVAAATAYPVDFHSSAVYRLEIERLNHELSCAVQQCAVLESVTAERDELKQRWDEFALYRKEPVLEELLSLRRIVRDQRRQMRLLSEACANQSSWINEWKKKSEENLQLQARLDAVQSGADVAELKRQVVGLTSALAACKSSFIQRGVLLSNAVTEVELLNLEVDRLKKRARVDDDAGGA